jgi:protein involved in polysaccharide export with SLBB domain
MSKSPAYILADNMSLYDLLFSRGGFQDAAFAKKAFLELGHIFRKTPGDLDTKILGFNLGKLLDGDPKENIRLESDDRIKIYFFESMATLKPYVSIEGLVKRPGNYDMSAGITMEDLIVIAGGLTPDASRVQGVIGRTARKTGDEAVGAEGGKSMTIIAALPLDFATLPKEQQTPLEVFDKIVIRHLTQWEPKDTVNISGQVQNPGSYALETKEERISNLIKRAGGINKEGFSAGASLMRRKDITGMGEEKKDEMDPVAVFIEKALAQPGGESDLILKDGDRIHIPKNPGVVEIRGAVRQPGFVQYRDSTRLEDYIKNAGGYLPNAEKRDVTVYLPNRTAQKRLRAFLFGSNPKVQAGSVIEVPYKETLTDKDKDIIPIKGAVKFPMPVKYRTGQRLEYYLRICGGFADNADPQKIIIQLPDGTTMESEKSAPFNPVVPAGSTVEVAVKEVKLEQADKDLVVVNGAVKYPMSVRFLEGQRLGYYIQACGGFADTADPGNIGVRIPDGTLLQNKNTAPFNPVILPGSIIEIQEKDSVLVRGAVESPLSVVFKEGQRLEYYIRLSGGYTAEADPSKINIRLPDGTLVQNKDTASFNPVIAVGSMIEVPDRTGKIPNVKKTTGEKAAEVKK